MRIDKLLVKRKFFSTRQKAKEAIKMGFVCVGGKVVTKPSMEVELDAEIVVNAEEKPKGYWKLAKLDSAWKLIKEKDIVLDVGSSAGGFLLYASDKAAKVYGIEFSKEFEKDLKEIEGERDNVIVFIEDAFTFDISKLEPIDVILNDLTLDASSSFKALVRFLPLLKEDGRVLFVLKTAKCKEPDFSKAGLGVAKRKDSDEKRERYYLLKKFNET
jgi:23S rRNA (cytidine1920-2'-O)/16S rRNA (cytidine1409-2'-O)-methyltransferase